MLRLVLIGNHNCGKTTIFNYLTGNQQRLLRIPGCTMPLREGTPLQQPQVSLLDLPGSYSLSPYTSEEILTRDQLLHNRPQLLINVLDATNIERSLYLTLQLLELGIPVVVGLNMINELTASGGSIDVQGLQQALGVPVLELDAHRGQGVEELLQKAVNVAAEQQNLHLHPAYSQQVLDALEAMCALIEPCTLPAGLPTRFCAIKLLEGDESILPELNLEPGILEKAVALQADMTKQLGDGDSLAAMRYGYIEELCAKYVHKPGPTAAQLRSLQLDRLLTHRYLGLPLFAAIMGLSFWLTFDVVGAFLSDRLEEIIGLITEAADAALASLEVHPALHSLIIDGVFAGVGSVLSFLPTIVTLFFFLSLLQDSGYMARVAFVMDKLLRRIGLSGSSFVPMIIGFGCSVPAIMATHSLSSERDRRMTILLTPFMSCSAKLPIYGVFIGAFFKENGGLVMLSLYSLGIIMALLTGYLMNRCVFAGEPVPLVMELPTYRLPTWRNIALQMLGRACDFVRKAFTIIFIASVAIWCLQNFDLHLNLVKDGDSMVASLGHVLAPLFAPLGFGTWQAATSLMCGLSAKEIVISTLSVLAVGSGDAPALDQLFTPLTAYTFLVFCLLYPPCIAALTTIRKELNSAQAIIGVIAYQIATAYIIAWVVRHIGLLLGFN